MNQKTIADILTDAAAIQQARAQVYGDNHARYAAMMAVAFPDGITLKTAADHDRFMVWALLIMKLSRYAVNWEHGHQDSIHDAVVYAAWLEALDDHRNQHGLGDDQRHHNTAPNEDQ
jgi:hypothetical protein